MHTMIREIQLTTNQPCMYLCLGSTFVWLQYKWSVQMQSLETRSWGADTIRHCQLYTPTWSIDTVRLSQLNVTVHITYSTHIHQLGNPMVCASCISDWSRLSDIAYRCNLEAVLQRLSKTLSFCTHTMLTNDCSLPLPHFSYVLYTVSLEIQSWFLPRSSATSVSTYVCT